MKNGKLQGSLNRVLSNMIFCKATKASKEGFHAFSRCCGILGQEHLWNNILPVHECLFWIWKRILTHFSLINCSSPSHHPQHHQKWSQIDLVQSFIIKHDFFLADWVNFFFMFLRTSYISNWWLIYFWSSLMYFTK